MERTEATGFGIAAAGHLLLLALLASSLDTCRIMSALTFGAVVCRLPTLPPAMEVSFVEDVGMVSSAPASIEPPAPAVGEQLGPVEEAAGASAAIPEAGPEAAPEPAPAPTETGDRRRPDVTRNAVPIRPPVERPVRTAEARPQPQQQRARPQQPSQRTSDSRAQGRGQAPRSSGSVLDRLSREFGRGPASAAGRSPEPQGAVVTSQVRASLDQAILRALQPCQRQTLPSPDARAIRVRVSVTLNQDGSLANARVAGVNDYDSDLRQYERRMREIALSVVRQCTPIRGLPAEYYSVARGWRQFNYTFPRT